MTATNEKENEACEQQQCVPAGFAHMVSRIELAKAVCLALTHRLALTGLVRTGRVLLGRKNAT